jgi:3-deoxy-D-manno-octulosonate 8-phosphate phosphatase (KDO 8-P phosphatase)
MTNPDFSRVELLAFDIDGTITDGRTYWLGPERGWGQIYDTRDGEAILRALRSGLKVIPVSRNKTLCARTRIESLGLATKWLASPDKLVSLNQVSVEHNVALEHVCFVGDGREDAPIIAAVGFGVAVADAHTDAITAAVHVSSRKGGDRVLEEIVDVIARSKGWP